MNERQRRFAEFYAADPNATVAAKAAGYSEKTARSAGQRLLTNVDIISYIKTLQDEQADLRIITLKQVKAFWSDIVTNPNEKTSDRLKASELLAKTAGAFIIAATKIKIPETFVNELNSQKDISNDVIIYLPELLSEEECEWPEDKSDAQYYS